MSNKLTALVLWTVALAIVGAVNSFMASWEYSVLLPLLVWVSMLSGAIYGIDADRADRGEAGLGRRTVNVTYTDAGRMQPLPYDRDD